MPSERFRSARVEHHAGELFPRIGFIVTNLETRAGRWYGSITSGARPSSNGMVRRCVTVEVLLTFNGGVIWKSAP